MDKINVTVLFSGGIDSTACINMFHGKQYKIKLLYIDYGQKSCEMEKKTVLNIANEMNLPISIRKYYSEHIYSVGEILGRNLFLLSAALLEQTSAGLIAMGIHAGTNYYDCSIDFFNLASSLISNYSAGQIAFVAPFIEWNKKEIWEYSKLNNLDRYKTYSCELGLIQPCKKCLSCKDLEFLK